MKCILVLIIGSVWYVCGAQTEIRLALIRDNVERLKILYSHNSNKALLTAAVSANAVKCIQYLIKQGYDPHDPLVLCVAIAENRVEACKVLIENGVQPDEGMCKLALVGQNPEIIALIEGALQKTTRMHEWSLMVPSVSWVPSPLSIAGIFLAIILAARSFYFSDHQYNDAKDNINANTGTTQDYEEEKQ